MTLATMLWGVVLGRVAFICIWHNVCLGVICVVNLGPVCEVFCLCVRRVLEKHLMYNVTWCGS